MNIVWLCSWYPNKTDAYTGDFIKRQAEALSLQSKIHVMHVVVNTYNNYECVIKENITEHIYYYKKINKLVDTFHFFYIHQLFFKQFKKKIGNIDIIHAQIPIKVGIVAWLWKIIYKIPYVLTEHYGIYNNMVEDPFVNRSVVFKWLTKKVIQQANSFLPVSSSLGVDINKLVVQKEFTPIPNVVNEHIFNFSAQIQKTVFRFIHVSNMIPLKRVEVIIEVGLELYKKRQDFEIVILGNKSEHIIQYLADKTIDEKCIVFKNNIPYTEVKNEMAMADCLLMYSTTESQSCVVLESLCIGRPVISSAVGGVVELLNDSNGMLVNSTNTEELLIAMNTMIDHYTKYNLETIAKGATQKYSYLQVGKQLIDIYKKILA
jgi:glycosyltransferase involved in cell wall biosynthesis